MNQLLGIFQGISAVDEQHLPSYLQAFQEHQTFNENFAGQKIEPIVVTINQLLNNAASRKTGLQILGAFTPQCALSILEERGLNWINVATRVALQRTPRDAVGFAYDVIGTIVARSIHIPELSKAITHNVIQKIVESVSDAPQNGLLAGLSCLEVCMKNYPGASGPYKNEIERIVLKIVDSSNEVLVTSAGRCLHLVQQIRGGGTHGSLHRKLWSDYHWQLIGSINETLALIFAHTLEPLRVRDYDERLRLPEMNLSAEPVKRAAQLVTRATNIVRFLELALLEPFPVAKAIRAVDIINTVRRGLSVSCSMMVKNSVSDNLALAALLPSLHVQLFGLLDAIIVVLRGNILPYCFDVTEMIQLALKWTNVGGSGGFRKPYLALRVAIYRTMSLWCQTTGYGSIMEDRAESIIQNVLDDATPHQSEITLKFQSGGGARNLSKRAKKKLLKSQNEGTHLAVTHSTPTATGSGVRSITRDVENEELAKAALNALVDFLNATGSLLKPSFHHVLQNKLIPLCFGIQNAIMDKTSLYAAPSCRQALYAALFALVANCHPLCPTPIQFVTILLRKARMLDANAEVRAACLEHLDNIEKILHPVKGSLRFPADLSDVRTTLQESNNFFQSTAKQPETKKAPTPLVEAEKPTAQSEVIELNESSSSVEEVAIEAENGPPRLENDAKESEPGVNESEDEVEKEHGAEAEKEQEAEEEEILPPPPQDMPIIEEERPEDVVTQAKRAQIEEDEQKDEEPRPKKSKVEEDALLDELLADFVPETISAEVSGNLSGSDSEDSED